VPAGGAARGGDRWLPGGRSCISPPSPRDPAGMKGSTSHQRSGRRRLQTDPGRRRPWIRPCATAATSSDHGQLDVLSLFFVRVLKKQEGFFVTAVRAGGRPSLPRRVRAGGPASGSDDGGAHAGQLRRVAAGPAGGGGGGRRVHGGSGKRSSQGWPHLSLARPLGGGGSFGAPRACGRAPLPCAGDVPCRCPFISRPPSPPRIKLAESIRSVCKSAEQSRACPLQHLATAVVIDSAYTGNGD